jgi:phage baseplate assembly protein V
MPVMPPVADIARRLENVLRFGVVASVDHAAALCTVSTGALLTRPLPWFAQRAGDARTRWAPSVGEQVLVLCPGGETTRGVVLAGLYSDANPMPAGSDTAHVTAYPDGAVVSYDPEAHQLLATLPDGGKADITATGGITLTGDVTIIGKLSVSDDATLSAKLHVVDDVQADATVTANTDVIGGGKSLKNHKHTGVQSGGAVSGPPQ